MLITVCIPSVRPTTLGHAIESIKVQSHESWELIVVGQGDEQTLRSAVEDAADGDERIRYRHLDRFGTCAARNRGIEQAMGEVIAFMDDDCEAAEDWLARIATTFEHHPEIGLLSGALVRPDPPPGSPKPMVCPEMVPFEVTYDPVETGYQSPPGFGAAGANLAVRRSVAEAVGPFDELLGPGARYASTEDTDYVLRVEALPTSLRSDPSVVVNHTHGHRFGLGASYRLLRSYAVGNGALAAKLALAGDDRGRQWLGNEFRATFIEPIGMRRPWLTPRRLVRLVIYASAYLSCRLRCQVIGGDLSSSVLALRENQARMAR